MVAGTERKWEACAPARAHERGGELAVAEEARAIEGLIDETNALRRRTGVVVRLEAVALRAEPFLRVALAAGYALNLSASMRSPGQRRLEVRGSVGGPGGIVSDPATFNLLLAHCTTVWLQTHPEDHMKRVIAQGDLRPMAASKEAMEDLKGILAGRAAFYSKADLTLDTSAQPLAGTFERLRAQVRQFLRLENTQ